MSKGEEILGLFPDHFRGMWNKVMERADSLQEIRLRASGPVMLLLDQRECFLTGADRKSVV